MDAIKRLKDSLAGNHWRGELSASALATATAVCALELHGRATAGRSCREVSQGVSWLSETQNSDGGWGDTPDSPSNISTTTLCWAVLGLTGLAPQALARAESRLRSEAGDLTAVNLAGVITRRYGEDRTFSAPILTMCALAGRFGPGRDAWREIPALPFELAAFPPSLYRLLGLPMVSYALPALIAIGQARHHHRPAGNPLARLLRASCRKATLSKLEAIQPENGGFLEATPLTSFVAMSLASMGLAEHAVAKKAIRFLLESRRPDGSWPIDSDLATWLTTLSINALSAGGRLSEHLERNQLAALAEWLLRQQRRSRHPYTWAEPGGWAWTDLPGGVPDADDTPGALLALRRLQEAQAVGQAEALEAASLGADWLIGLQNRDGGIPTFCRGWGRLPFDRSSPDLTAHALRAWHTWRADLSPALQRKLGEAVPKALRFLIASQRENGAWVPLWFGNQSAPRQENPVYGTSRVLRACRASSGSAAIDRPWKEALGKACRWLLSAQSDDGGWGGASGVAPSVEETALAVEALRHAGRGAEAAARGMRWIEKHGEDPPAPIGLYFARLWYSEKLYPVIFASAAQETSR